MRKRAAKLGGWGPSRTSGTLRYRLRRSHSSEAVRTAVIEDQDSTDDPSVQMRQPKPDALAVLRHPQEVVEEPPTASTRSCSTHKERTDCPQVCCRRTTGAHA